MQPVVLENKYREVNNLQKHNFIKIKSYPATCFDPVGVIFRVIFETRLEVYRSCAGGRSRLLQVFVTSLVFIYI